MTNCKLFKWFQNDICLCCRRWGRSIQNKTFVCFSRTQPHLPLFLFRDFSLVVLELAITQNQFPTKIIHLLNCRATIISIRIVTEHPIEMSCLPTRLYVLITIHHLRFVAWLFNYSVLQFRLNTTTKTNNQRGGKGDDDDDDVDDEDDEDDEGDENDDDDSEHEHTPEMIEWCELDTENELIEHIETVECNYWEILENSFVWFDICRWNSFCRFQLSTIRRDQSIVIVRHDVWVWAMVVLGVFACMCVCSYVCVYECVGEYAWGFACFRICAWCQIIFQVNIHGEDQS